jgi:cytosine/uracil/thiamine/allantoin permease
MKRFFENLFWFFEGSNLFAFICLTLGLMFGVFGYLAPDADWTLRATFYAFASVLSVFGASIYFYNFINRNTGGKFAAR